MRQRTVKNREAIVEDCRAWLVELPFEKKGSWQLEFRRSAPLFIEIGSGKGRFLCTTAALHPENNYLAAEGGDNISVRILQKAKEEDIQNIRLIGEYISHPAEMFGQGELSGIYINFCDPWPKARHEHRRLTSRRFLEEYKRVVKPGGFLAFKTDNDELFAFSLEEFKACGLEPVRITRDLHSSPWAADNVMTEYEEKFSSAGKTINYAFILFPQVEIPRDI